VKILAVYQSLSWTLIALDLSDCLGGDFPIFMAGDLNVNHVDWKSRVITTRDKIMREKADEYSGLTYGPNTPTTIPYNPSATLGVLDIVIKKYHVTPVHITACSALSLDHLLTLIDTRC
jgi:hypothetical protein